MTSEKAKYFYTWARQREEVKELCIIFENVEFFPLEILQRALPSYRLLVWWIICPKKLGCKINRKRKKAVLVLKDFRLPSAMFEADLQKMFWDIFGRAASYNFESYFIATDKELENERQWGITRKEVEKRHNGPEGDPFKDDPGSFLAALIPNERKRLGMYEQQFPGQLCDLGQNPEKRSLISKGDCLGTMLRSCGINWIPEHLRWMSAREHLFSMGFPLTAEHIEAANGAVCCFSDHIPAPLRRTRRSMLNQGGNSMHTIAIGSVMMFVMLAIPGVGIEKVDDKIEEQMLSGHCGARMQTPHRSAMPSPVVAAVPRRREDFSIRMLNIRLRSNRRSRSPKRREGCDRA